MVPDNRDILFSGKASTWLGSVSQTFEAEVTHLTCFIGGMVGMGAKLFDIPTDIEIAKKLSDGCVWAYESTPSGIMPEYAHVLACESIKDCPWNETLWREALDPMTAAQRAKQIAIYEDQKVIQAAQKEEERQALEAKAIIEAELAAAKATAAPEAEEERPPTGDSQPEEKTTPEMRTDVDSKAPSSTRYEDSLVEAVPAAESAKSFKKRDVILDANETLKPTALGNKEITSATPETKKALPSVDPVQQRLQEKLAVLQLELKKLSKPHHPETDVIDPVNSIETNNTFTPTPTEQVPINRVSNPEVVDVGRPQTHDEFVEEKIKTQNIPTGYIKINSDQYILR
jgi:mannosyl-oligosaccharide alpha-1,2-mannosidase